jgi:hypothetical protein
MPDFLISLFGWGGRVLLITVVGVMIWRRLYRQFPLLLIYFVVTILVAIVREVVDLKFSFRSMEYFYTFWFSEPFTVLAAFAALYEVFLIRAFPSFYRTPILRYVFPLIAVLGIGVGIIVFLTAPRYGPNGLSVLVGRSVLALDFTRVVLLLLFTLVSLTLGGGWEEHEYGIVLGYGFYAISNLITTAVRAKASYHKTSVDQMPVVGYFAALVIWLIYLSREYKSPYIDIPLELVKKSQSWDKLLRQFTSQRQH